MTEILLYVVLVFAAGSFALILFSKRKTTSAAPGDTSAELLAEQKERIASLQQELIEKDSALRHAELENARLDEKLLGLGSQQEAMKNQFKVLAADALKQQSDDIQKALREGNKAHLDTVLSPFQKHLDLFEKQVNEGYDKNRKERIELKEEMKTLIQNTNTLSKDANDLTRAMRGDVKAQGNWGELVLETLLKKCGFIEGEQYELQAHEVGEDGRRYHPDVVVNMPEGKHLIIDSKVSLVHYERFCNTDDPDDQAAALDLLVGSVRSHVKGLSEKSYENLKGSTLDFVLLYIPIEGAYSVAVQKAPELFQESFDQNVVLVANTTLWATLRTVGVLWRQEKQSKNLKAIIDGASKLYDKFVGFTEDMVKVGKQIDTARGTYDDAMNKMVDGRGNIVSRFESLKKLGLKNTKHQDEDLLEAATPEELTLLKEGESGE